MISIYELGTRRLVKQMGRHPHPMKDNPNLIPLDTMASFDSFQYAVELAERGECDVLVVSHDDMFQGTVAIIDGVEYLPIEDVQIAGKIASGETFRQRAVLALSKSISAVSEALCVLAHTRADANPLDYHNWCQEMEKTHLLKRCPICGAYAIWERRGE